MFEHFGDFERAAAATERFPAALRHRVHDLDCRRFGQGRGGQEAADAGPGLRFSDDNFHRPQGQVRKIHTGYSGPATGEHYTQFVAEFKSTLAQLLAETSVLN